MKLSIIAAVTRSGALGMDGQLLYRIPEDMKHFMRSTMDCPIIMGRKTYESIGMALPGRKNIVVTRTLPETYGVHRVLTLEDAIAKARNTGAKQAWVIGGEALYRASFDLVDEFVLTVIGTDKGGDVHFPHFRDGAFTSGVASTLKCENIDHFVHMQGNKEINCKILRYKRS